MSTVDRWMFRVWHWVGCLLVIVGLLWMFMGAWLRGLTDVALGLGQVLLVRHLRRKVL